LEHLVPSPQQYGCDIQKWPETLTYIIFPFFGGGGGVGENIGDFSPLAQA